MHGDELVVGLFVVALAALFGGPILALVAWVRLRRVERLLSTPRTDLASIEAVAQRIQALEDRIALLAHERAVVPTPPPVEPVAEAPVPVQTPGPAVRPAGVEEPAASPAAVAAVGEPPAAAPAPIFSGPLPDVPPPLDLESRIAGRWMNRVGLVAVAIGVSYFLKYAIDNDWIGPAGQVAIGLLLGAGLVALGPVFLRKGFVYFADGITGLGAAVLYLSLWAAGSYYTLISQAAAFVAMIVVTAAILAIAIGRNSQRVAIIAMIGGFMTPALVSTGRDAQVVLFSYLALHTSALLALARARDWRFLEFPALAFTELYFWTWYGRFYTSPRLASTLAFATLFFMQFAAVPVIRSRRTGSLHPEQALLLVLNAGLILLVFYEVLWPEHRWLLAFATLALAAVHLALARGVPGAGSLPQLILAGLALTYVTLAVPISLSARWITMAWAVEAAVIMWTGLRTRLAYLRAAGFVLFGLVALSLVDEPLRAGQFLFNVRFATYLVVAAAIAASLWFAARIETERSDLEQTGWGALAVALNVVLVIALTSEVILFYRPEVSGLAATVDRWSVRPIDDRLAEGLSISLLWALYGSGLVFAGVRWSSQALRWQGLILLGFTTLKVFFTDLAMLRGFYRVVSSIALGVVLLVISYVYQRRVIARAPGTE
jgi:uncharacterized membrane protein